MVNDEPLFNKFTDLCNKLNLDQETTNAAFEHFQTIQQNYTIEGEPLHWLACAIYIISSKKVTPTVDQEGETQGDGINFTSLLRHSKLSLARFFSNMKIMSEMVDFSDDLSKRIENLEKSVRVAYNVFNTYPLMFFKLFKAVELAELENLKQNRSNRKQRQLPCTPLKVFEFCWLLFITIKGQEPKHYNDLVTSCNLLMAICDWAFRVAFESNRKDLINSNFDGLPLDWNSINYQQSECPCVIYYLCSNVSMVTDVKYVKEYQFQSSIKALFDQGVLTGLNTNDFDCFNSSVFERNFKNITNTYETNILNKVEIDEKIFLAEHKRKLLKQLEEAPVKTNQCLTPLTGRNYLNESTNSINSEKLTQLTALLSDCQPEPSLNLLELFDSCTRNPKERITLIVEKLETTFIDAYINPEAKTHLSFAKKLFYKLIEGILSNEKQIQADISVIVENDIFYESIFACSLEIILHTYSSPNHFPWIMNALSIQSYNFVKVIELIIRAKLKFSRDTIKHLSMIEELNLSSLIWRSDSRIWMDIENADQEIPKFVEIALPGQIQTDREALLQQEQGKIVQTPGLSATDRFQSPGGLLNRELFPSQATHLVIKDLNGKTRMIQVKMQPPVVKQEQHCPSRPRRTGSLSIIFRKFYNLAWERMEHLCNNLLITHKETQQKIWTAFEELVRKDHCDLIKDRDLDQLLMCAVYIMITKLNRLDGQEPLMFADIIKSYRRQPQATSAIYRKVLITKAKSIENEAGEVMQVPENRGDLIQFYNSVVITALKRFAQSFVDRDGNGTDVLLSPLPASRGNQLVQVYGNICIKPLESPSMNLSNGKVFNFYFNRSPSKDLNDINKAVKGSGGVIGKRLLGDGDGDSDLPISKRISMKKVQWMIEDRNQNTE